jgi:outer membrane protein OmpA-like peptidoglycan-associated protein
MYIKHNLTRQTTFCIASLVACLSAGCATVTASVVEVNPVELLGPTPIGIDTGQRALPTISSNISLPAHYQHVYIDTSMKNASSLQTISLADAVSSNVLASSDFQVQTLAKIDPVKLKWAVLDRGFERPKEIEGVGGAGAQANNFSEVNFIWNGTDILNPDRLQALVSLASRVGGVFHVVGYADESGVEASNKTLSEERAKAVVTALTAAGVNPSRVLAAGAGVSRLYRGLDANRRASIAFRVVE